MGESPSQYTVKKLGTTYVPVISSTDSATIGSSFVVCNYNTEIVRVPSPAYSIIQRDNYYDETVSVDLNEVDDSYEPIPLIKLPCEHIVSLVNYVYDVDGNEYTYVTIGTQQWMVENLKTTKYRDGAAIPNIIDYGDWALDINGAYAWYNNDIVNKIPYGAFYNWYAVENIHGLAPTGWRIPSGTDWNKLITFLGGQDIGGKLREVGLSHWEYPNEGATNDYGFNAIGSGDRSYVADAHINIYTYYWTSTETDATTAEMTFLSIYSFSCPDSGVLKRVGVSVRCMRDIP